VRLPWGLRWWELLPEVVLGAGLTFFLVTETSAATSAFGSGTAIARMALVAAAWSVARIALVRCTSWPGLRFAVFAAATVGVLAVVVLPAYDDNTVVEALPVVAPETTLPSAPPDGPLTPSTTATTAPAVPVALRSASIRGIDHRASGTAVAYRQPDGSLLIGLEDIDIQPGPDYDVYLVPGVDRDDPDDGTRLDDLRGNKGTQYYPVPAGTDVASGPWTVLVWCQTFDVPVAAASLA